MLLVLYKFAASATFCCCLSFAFCTICLAPCAAALSGAGSKCRVCVHAALFYLPHFNAEAASSSSKGICSVSVPVLSIVTI